MFYCTSNAKMLVQTILTKAIIENYCNDCEKNLLIRYVHLNTEFPIKITKYSGLHAVTFNARTINYRYKLFD